MIKKYVFAIIISSCVACANLSIYSSLDKEANFSNYKKFAWAPQRHEYLIPDKSLNADSVENKIQRAVMEEFRLRGISLDTANPDILVDYDIMIKKKLKPDSLLNFGPKPIFYRNFQRYSEYTYNNKQYYYGKWNQYYSDAYTAVINNKPVKIDYDEGTLLIDIVDIKANKLVWKGIATEEVFNPVLFDLELATDISKMFKSYPIQALK